MLPDSKASRVSTTRPTCLRSPISRTSGWSVMSTKTILATFTSAILPRFASTPSPTAFSKAVSAMSRAYSIPTRAPPRSASYLPIPMAPSGPACSPWPLSARASRSRTSSCPRLPSCACKIKTGFSARRPPTPFAASRCRLPACPAACNKSSTEPRHATNSSRTRSRSPPQLRGRANDSCSHRFRPAQPHPRTQRGPGAVHLGHYFVSQSTLRGLSRRRRHLHADHHAVARSRRRRSRTADHRPDRSRSERRSPQDPSPLCFARRPLSRHHHLRRRDLHLQRAPGSARPPAVSDTPHQRKRESRPRLQPHRPDHVLYPQERESALRRDGAHDSPRLVGVQQA